MLESQMKDKRKEAIKEEEHRVEEVQDYISPRDEPKQRSAKKSFQNNIEEDLQLENAISSSSEEEDSESSDEDSDQDEFKVEKVQEEVKRQQSPIKNIKESQEINENEIVEELIDELKQTTKLSESDVQPQSPERKEIVDSQNVEVILETDQSDDKSHISIKTGVSESKVYYTEEDFMKSLRLEEIKEESSNVTSGGTPLQVNPKMKGHEEKASLKPVKTKFQKKIKPKIKPKETEGDPLDILSQDFEIVNQTVDKFSSAVDESSHFQDTIIGSEHNKKFKVKEPSPSKIRNKENKVPSLNLGSTVKKFNNPSVINIEPEDDLIDLLISEGGDVQEESIIQISENIKKNPVKISKSKLVRVDPVQKFNEILKNSHRSNMEMDPVRDNHKAKPINYPIRSNEEEESVKLEELGFNLKDREKKNILHSQNSANPNPKGMKNIFFDISSHKDANEEDVLDFIEAEDYDEQSIQSQRNQFTPNNLDKKPIFFGKPPNKAIENLKRKVRKPINFEDKDSIDDLLNQ